MVRAIHRRQIAVASDSNMRLKICRHDKRMAAVLHPPCLSVPAMWAVGCSRKWVGQRVRDWDVRIRDAHKSLKYVICWIFAYILLFIVCLSFSLIGRGAFEQCWFGQQRRYSCTWRWLQNVHKENDEISIWECLKLFSYLLFYQMII